MNYYGDLFNRNTDSESLQNKRTEKNIEVLDDIFKNSVGERIFEDTTNLSSTDNFFSISNDGDRENKSNFGFSDVQKSEPSIDPFNSTSEISKVDLEKALNSDLGNDIDAYKKLRGLLSDYDNNSEVQNSPIEEAQSSSQTNGKVLVKSTNPVKKYSNDTSEILQAFISCSILSFITAGMGVGWLLYIIMHI